MNLSKNANLIKKLELHQETLMSLTAVEPWELFSDTLTIRSHAATCQRTCNCWGARV